MWWRSFSRTDRTLSCKCQFQIYQNALEFLSQGIFPEVDGAFAVQDERRAVFVYGQTIIFLNAVKSL